MLLIISKQKWLILWTQSTEPRVNDPDRTDSSECGGFVLRVRRQNNKRNLYSEAATASRTSTTVRTSSRLIAPSDNWQIFSRGVLSKFASLEHDELHRRHSAIVDHPYVDRCTMKSFAKLLFSKRMKIWLMWSPIVANKAIPSHTGSDARLIKLNCPRAGIMVRVNN